MTYAGDVAADRHRVGYYVVFDGVETRLSTHDLTGLVAGTYLEVLVGPPTGGGVRLDRRRGLVLPDGFSARAFGNAAAHAYFARRAGTEEALLASMTASTDSVEIPETYAEGTDICLDKETITLGNYHVSLDLYENCTRGAHGSVAAAHASGAICSTKARHWRGRRAELFAVNLSTGTTQAIRTGVLRASPSCRGGVYSLDFTDASRELDRPIYQGWYPQRVTEATITDGDLVLKVGDAKNFVEDTRSFVKVAYDDRLDVYRLDGVTSTLNTSTNVLTLARSDYQGSFGHGERLHNGAVDLSTQVDVQQVLYMVADPARVALTMMMSILGDGANSGLYDVLPGRAPAVNDTHILRRLGAGVPSAWVDVASFADWAGVGGSMAVFVDQPTTLLEFLEREVLLRLGGYLYVNGVGQLAFQRWRIAVPDSSLDVLDANDDAIGFDVDAVDDETDVLASAVFDLNWDPYAREYQRTIAVQWQDTAPIYGDESQQIDLSSKTLRVGQASASPLLSQPFGNETELVAMLDRLYSRTRRGVRKVRVTLPWRRHVDYLPGHVFKLTDARLPDGDGGVGVTERQHEVVAASLDYGGGTVEVEAEEMPQGWLIAPSYIVSSKSGNNILADTTGDEGDIFDSLPGRDFPVGCSVRIYDASASPPYSVSEVETVTAVGDGFITVASLPSAFTVALGDLVVLENGANTGTPNSDDADVQDHLYMANSNGLIDEGGATERDGTVWG